MTSTPSDLYDPSDVPVLLQSAAHHLRLAEQALMESSEAPEDAFDPLAKEANLSFLSECLTRQELLSNRLRKVVAKCRAAYHPGMS